jgi:hypothetical protein
VISDADKYFGNSAILKLLLQNGKVRLSHSLTTMISIKIEGDLREFAEETREEARRKRPKWDDAESAGNKSTSK